MNRLNWIQQEQEIAEYHVVKWSTSHFHQHKNRTDIVGPIQTKTEGGASASSEVQLRPDGIGLGLADPIEERKWTTGGLGEEGLVESGTKTARTNEAVSRPDRKSGRQNMSTDSVAEALQTIMPEEVYSVVNSVRQTALKAQGRIKQSTARLRDIYQKQRKATEETSVQKHQNHRQPETNRQGTRQVNKEEVLFMQVENHYLLDSYDRNGQYSMLGK